MYMNYMDYVDDRCMVMFSQLQLVRADDSIQRYRGGFRSSAQRHSSAQFVNWLYFRTFSEEQTENKDAICYGKDELFYDNNINEDSASNLYIYGCLTRTDVMTIGHITDIKFITGEQTECGDGYFRASQDLNEV
eukprot:TRINITY_DN3364_c0_g1_i1.p1 TRINITY_DN3364_c0_g1~~TRINITY_DN3364_c0_g1_i1.p1  ORF type:complete len:134 (-),score=6.87 TRINITY_DN3364_c0_g1_i1:141-542(-)